MLKDTGDHDPREPSDGSTGFTRYGYKFRRVKVYGMNVIVVGPTTPEGHADASIKARDIAQTSNVAVWREIDTGNEVWLDCSDVVDFAEPMADVTRKLKKAASKKYGVINERAEIKSLEFIPKTKAGRRKLAALLRELADDVEKGWD